MIRAAVHAVLRDPPNLRRHVGVLVSMGHLYVVQVLNYVVPLVTLPFLARVLEPSGLARFAFAQAICQYFALLTDYGFSLSGSRQVALVRDDPGQLKRVVNDVFMARLALAGSGCFILLVAAHWVTGERLHPTELYAGATAVIGTLLFPAWFYQGMEKFAEMTWLAAVARLGSVPLLLICVRGPKDVDIALLLSGCPLIVAGIAASIRHWDVLSPWSVRPSPAGIKFALKEGWPVFLSTVAYNLYTATNTVIVGARADAAGMAAFTTAQRVHATIRLFINPAVQVAYPVVTRAATGSHRLHPRLLQLALALGVVFGCVSILIYFASPWIVSILFGDKYRSAVPLMQIMAPIPLILAVSNCVVTLGLLAAGHSRRWAVVVQSTVIVNFLSIGLLMTVLPIEQAVATTLVINEAWILVFGLVQLRQMRELENRRDACHG